MERQADKHYDKHMRKEARAEARIAAVKVIEDKKFEKKLAKEKRHHERRNKAHMDRLAADSRYNDTFRAREKARGGEPPRDLPDESLPEISDEGAPAAKRRVFGPRPPPKRQRTKPPRMKPPVTSSECDSENDKALAANHEKLSKKIRKLGGQRGPKTPERLK